MDLCAIKTSSCLDATQARVQLSVELKRCLRAAGEGVVGLVAWNLDAPRPFLVFELAHAGTLADEMRRHLAAGRVYHPVAALERIREILRSLANVHAKGLVHRDVKPANLLRFGKEIKLTDFGTGCTLGAPTTLQTEAFVGTRAYAAPEQLRGEAVDDRADLYAVGCILHEMLVGRIPGSTGMRGSRHYPHLLVLPEAEALLQSLLAEDPRQRPDDALDAIARVDVALRCYRAARLAWMNLGLGPSPY
jgi:serine/threonine-protein kinase